MPEFHPSYGYATAAQFDRLKEIGPGYEREQILKAIREQTPAKPRKKK
jgi:hypothetical protein